MRLISGRDKNVRLKAPPGMDGALFHERGVKWITAGFVFFLTDIIKIFKMNILCGIKVILTDTSQERQIKSAEIFRRGLSC
jgi:hypothetical protein